MASVDLENWMDALPDQLKLMPFIYLAIPGSHDAMTYGINRQSTLAPDAPTALRRIWPVFKGTIIRWTKTQEIDVVQQLKCGIRYFDLRLATKDGTKDLYFTHALYAGEVTKPLGELKNFLDEHPKEVVVLDCQHFYAFQMDDHRKLFTILINMFGSRICPPQRDLENITLASMNRNKQQIIIVYRNEIATSSGRFWRNGQFPTPWPRQLTTTGLIAWMSDVRRPPGIGFVLQSVLTPEIPFIIMRWRSNVKEACAKPVVRSVLPWIENLYPGPPPPFPSDETVRVNVVISDFVDYNDCAFPRSIIALNDKLIEH